jgi:raffinose/stachyose/melibiose transport system permease protein
MAEVTSGGASYLMALAPMLIVYVIAQRWVISDLMRGAIR